MDDRFEMFTVLIAEIGRCIYRIKAEEMGGIALRGSHVNILYYLYKSGSLTAKELSGASGEDKANVSRAVRYLEEGGYISCASPAQKRYQSPLGLTEKGLETGKYIAERVDGILERASEGLSDGERAAMYKALRLILANLRGICAGYGGGEDR